MEDIRTEASRRVENKLYFDHHRFFEMMTVWLVCAVFMFFPLVLRPMFVHTSSPAEAAYWNMIMSDNDVMYLIAGISVLALGLAIIIGRHGSGFVYFIAVLQGIGIFLAIMGYLMLEGDPSLFGENVMRINVAALIVSVILALVLFIAVSFRVKEVAGRR